MDLVWGSLMQVLEAELCEKADIVEEEALPQYQGRARPISWALRPLKPPRLVAGHHLSEATRIWNWLERRLQELRHLFDNVGLGRISKHQAGTQLQLAGIQRSLFQYVPRLAALGQSLAHVWQKRLRKLAHVVDLTLNMRLQLDDWYEQAKVKAEDGVREDARQRRQKHQEYIQSISEGSASMLHRISKPLIPWHPWFSLYLWLI